MAESRKRQTSVFILLILAAGTVYKVPYLKAVFYDQLVASLDITNTQLGILSSFYAGVKMLIYIPCGIIADRLDTKKCLVFSLLGEGILTGVYALLPSFGILELIQALLALVNVFFWTSFIKSIRILGKNMAQGKIFGLSEGLRGITGSIATFIALKCASMMAETAHSIRGALLFYGALYLVTGILILFLYPNDMEEDADHHQTWADYVAVFKKPAIWMVSLLIFTTYSMQVAFEYTTTYMTQVLGIAAVTVGTIATIRDNICGVIGAPLAGAYADRVKSSTKVISWLIVVEIVLSVVLFLSPETPKIAYAAMGFVLVFSVVLHGVRGVYYSTMSETGIPVSMTATATAVVAVLGYTPDMFMSLWCGHILDAYGYEAGFKKIFAMIVIFGIIAWGISLVMRSYQKRLSAKQK